MRDFTTNIDSVISEIESKYLIENNSNGCRFLYADLLLLEPLTGSQIGRNVIRIVNNEDFYISPVIIESLNQVFKAIDDYCNYASTFAGELDDYSNYEKTHVLNAIRDKLIKKYKRI